MPKKYRVQVIGKKSRGGTSTFSVDIETDASVAGDRKATKEMFKKLVDSQHPEVYRDKGVEEIEIISW